MITRVDMNVILVNLRDLTKLNLIHLVVDEVVPWWVAAAAGWGTSTLQYVFNNVGEGEASYQL